MSGQRELCSGTKQGSDFGLTPSWPRCCVVSLDIENCRGYQTGEDGLDRAGRLLP